MDLRTLAVSALQRRCALLRGLVKALAQAEDVELTVVGNRRSDEVIERPFMGLQNVTFIDLAPPTTLPARSLLTRLPKDAFVLATPALKATLHDLLNRTWHWLVVDHAYSSGLLDMILSRRKTASICYVAHNAEGLIRPQIAKSFSNPVRRALMQIDAYKYRRQEQQLISELECRDLHHRR